MKVGIIGAGMVGANAAFAIVMRGVASEVVLIDYNRKLAEAQAMDILHATPFAVPARVVSGDYPDLAGADVVILAAGANQKPGETRLQLLERNAAIQAQIVPAVLAAAPDALLIVAANPVDIMTDVATRLSGLPPSRVIGTGTLLDTARFRSLLGDHFGVSPKSVHAWVVGEHGDSEVLSWSSATIGSIAIDRLAIQLGRDFTDATRAMIDDSVRRAAYRIIDGKGATWFGIGAGIARLLHAIVADEHAVLTVSCRSVLPGETEPVTLSVPRVIGRTGAGDALWPELNETERQAFAASAAILRDAAARLNL